MSTLSVADLRDPEEPTSDDRVYRLIAESVTGPFGEAVRSWINWASLEDILAWKPPDIGDLHASHAEYRGSESRLVWIVDRFLETYLDLWSMESLRLEWEYLHGRTPGACSSDNMRRRKIAEDVLARTLAARSVEEARGEGSNSDGALSIDKLTRPAVAFLENNRRAEAAAIFDAARTVSPQNPEAHNNYGFCLLPDHPEEALRALDRANELGYHAPVLNLANRLFGLLNLRRLTTGLECAEEFFRDWESWNIEGGYLWSTEPRDDPQLVLVADARIYILEIAVHLASATGDESLITEWQLRLKEKTTA
jgi:hypothetical protein